MIEKFILGKNINMEIADLIARTAVKFKSETTFISANKKINCKSVLGIISLGAKLGDEIAVYSFGVDEAEASRAIKELLK